MLDQPKIIFKLPGTFKIRALSPYVYFLICLPSHYFFLHSAVVNKFKVGWKKPEFGSTLFRIRIRIHILNWIRIRIKRERNVVVFSRLCVTSWPGVSWALWRRPARTTSRPRLTGTGNTVTVTASVGDPHTLPGIMQIRIGVKLNLDTDPGCE